MNALDLQALEHKFFGVTQEIIWQTFTSYQDMMGKMPKKEQTTKEILRDMDYLEHLVC